MQVHVFDIRATSSSLQYTYFDVLVDSNNKDRVKEFAKIYLSSLGINSDRINQLQCNFCHSEIANPEVITTIEQYGYCIIPLQIN
ncbi:DUF2024 family protein [Shewanella sp. D64]|uniref:DUF2024 family protein n=1 Tax=unclassified Shewanella TaxID=196818 RepID=UPI0022BA6525|nr:MULTISPECIES: DUF2024 family protein [unclassified Shewanella]MEC4727392.1 DUF2024 family protein [Shewanella sp. D64]MEC4739547.1 DUF2024 family protein [Shewanella sp. E94]WBJ96070.1 DUF2024 family protein [Shewanella sp. MTB7]